MCRGVGYTLLYLGKYKKSKKKKDLIEMKDSIKMKITGNFL